MGVDMGKGQNYEGSGLEIPYTVRYVIDPSMMSLIETQPEPHTRLCDHILYFLAGGATILIILCVLFIILGWTFGYCRRTLAKSSHRAMTGVQDKHCQHVTL